MYQPDDENPRTRPSSRLGETALIRQQPLVPEPSLHLLAGLTNATAQTPWTGVVRRIRIWTPLVTLSLVAFSAVQLVRPLPEPSLVLSRPVQSTFGGGALNLPWPGEGQAAVEVEGVGVMGVEGVQKPAPIASVAKTMTAYVILQGHPLMRGENGPLIEVDQRAEDESRAKDESTAPITRGQKFTQRQMLQLLMIPSANNVARLLARWDAQSEEAFVEKMNDAAKALGMTDTTYTDPSGLETTTVSTASDQLKLAKTVLKNDVFRKIVNTPQIDIPGVPGRIYNNNGRALLEPGVHGIKTGSSTPAGGNLLWSASAVVDGQRRRIVGAVFGIQTGATVDAKLQEAITDSVRLIRAAQRSVSSMPIAEKGDVIGYVDDGLGGRTPVVVTRDLRAIGWRGLDVEIHLRGGGIPHAAKAGTVVGRLSVGSSDSAMSVPVALLSDVEEPGVWAQLERLS